MLAILSTHPIQYQVPLWQALAKDGSVPFEVWYLSDHGSRPSFDIEFQRQFSWDIDMFAGYQSRLLTVNDGHDVARFAKLRLNEPLGKRLHDNKVKALWIQGWQVTAYWQAVWQAAEADVPVWLRGESNDLAPISLLKEPIKQLSLRRLFSKVSKFLYIGESNRRFYKRFGIKDERLVPGYYCVDNARFNSQAEALRPRRDEIRSQWNIPSDSFCVLFAGKFIPKKRPLDLVAAVKKLIGERAGQRIHILFVGSGELDEELRAACDVAYEVNKDVVTSGLTDRVRASFTGFLNQTEISQAYVAADCLVLPSDYGETWGLVVNEAMASSLPCVASDACGCSEDLVQPIRPEFRFKLGDISSLALAIESVMKSKPDSDVLLRRVDQFRLENSVASIVSLYRSFAATGN
ncbi:MAG TPA: glycosyltransferase family 4 protein [Pyrinomonadaceae bacterium]